MHSRRVAIARILIEHGTDLDLNRFPIYFVNKPVNDTQTVKVTDFRRRRRKMQEAVTLFNMQTPGVVGTFCCT